MSIPPDSCQCCQQWSQHFERLEKEFDEKFMEDSLKLIEKCYKAINKANARGITETPVCAVENPIVRAELERKGFRYTRQNCPSIYEPGKNCTPGRVYWSHYSKK